MQKLSAFAFVLVIGMTASTLTGCIGALRGQDIKEGSQLIIELQQTPATPQISDRELEAVKKVIENRINGLGISQSLVQITGKNQILVQLPTVKDPKAAQRVLGPTAQLEFKKQKPNTETQLFALRASRNELKAKQEELQTTKDTAAIAKNQQALQNNSSLIAQLFESTNPPLTGRYLKDAYGEPTQGNNWDVAIRFDLTPSK